MPISRMCSRACPRTRLSALTCSCHTAGNPLRPDYWPPWAWVCRTLTVYPQSSSDRRLLKKYSKAKTIYWRMQSHDHHACSCTNHCMWPHDSVCMRSHEQFVQARTFSKPPWSNCHVNAKPCAFLAASTARKAFPRVCLKLRRSLDLLPERRRTVSTLSGCAAG